MYDKIHYKLKKKKLKRNLHKLSCQQWQDFPEIEEIPMDGLGCLARMLEDKEPALDRAGRNQPNLRWLPVDWSEALKFQRPLCGRQSDLGTQQVTPTGVQISTSRSTHQSWARGSAGELREMNLCMMCAEPPQAQDSWALEMERARKLRPLGHLISRDRRGIKKLRETPLGQCCMKSIRQLHTRMRARGAEKAGGQRELEPEAALPQFRKQLASQWSTNRPQQFSIFPA